MATSNKGIISQSLVNKILTLYKSRTYEGVFSASPKTALFFLHKTKQAGLLPSCLKLLWFFCYFSPF